jgi:dipeptidase E
MRLYLSSYKLGHRYDRFMDMVPRSMRIGLVVNAKDHLDAPARRAKVTEASDMLTRSLGGQVSEIDLRDYSYNTRNLRRTLSHVDALWVHGGDVFVLREALAKSGGDALIRELITRDELVYGGESAAGCVLGTDLRAFASSRTGVSRAYLEGRPGHTRGLGVLAYTFIPHVRDHVGLGGDRDVRDAVKYCERVGTPFRCVRDGEALLVDGDTTTLLAS